MAETYVTIFDELNDYVNNFRSFPSYEAFTHTHHFPNHRKKIQDLMHALLTNYEIHPIGGN